MNTPPTNDITERVAKLKASPHFDTLYDGYARYIEKQGILLVLCGKKPVSEAISCTYVAIPHGKKSAPDNEQQVGKLLASLGLAYHLWSDENVTQAVVSLDPKLVDEYMQAHDYSNVGRLFGYPETAIEAFTTDQAISMEEQDRLMAAAGLPEFMPQFRLSKAHAQEELKTLQDWHQTIVAYGLDGS